MLGTPGPRTQRSNIDRDNLAARARADEHCSRQPIQHDYVCHDLRNPVEMERARECRSTDGRVFGFDIGEDNREIVAHRLFARPLPRQVRSDN